MEIRKYSFNENFFEEVDTEEKAYILGFLYADGNVFKSKEFNSIKISMSQLEDSIDILNKITKCLDSNYSLHKVQQPNGKICYNLNLYSTKMGNDLINLGCVENKSLQLNFPTHIKANLIRHFIRGYFDGDGCVWEGKRKKMTVKDKTKKEGTRERIVHNVKFTFTGCFSFINSLQGLLIKEGVVKSKTKLNFSKAKNLNNTSENVCTMEYSGRRQMKKLFDFMYKNSTIYGDVKYDKFKNICCAPIEKSVGETSLTAGTPEMVISNQASKLEEGSSTIPEMEVESSDSKCEALNR